MVPSFHRMSLISCSAWVEGLSSKVAFEPSSFSTVPPNE